jgi:hypothetical protein
MTNVGQGFRFAGDAARRSEKWVFRTPIRRPRCPETSPGVSRDGGGFIIVNGHIIRIPPWDPLRQVLDVAVAIQAVSEIRSDKSVRAREMLYDLMIDIAKQAKKQLKE